MTNNRVQDIVFRFFNTEEISRIEPIEKGLINDTYFLKSKSSKRDYVLQKINRQVFREPEKVMNNLILIQNTLKIEQDSTYHLPDLIPDKKGELYYIDHNQDYWRVFTYIQDSRTIEIVENSSQAFEAAKAFGNFIKNLASLEASQLNETIYRFHDYKNRIEVFEEAIEEDKLGRRRKCPVEIDQIYKRSNYIKKFYSVELPVRVVHGDAKIHNVLFSSETDKAIAVIDLDISMPATILYDYGELVRSLANSTSEDDPNTSNIKIDKVIFTELTHGFLSETSDILIEKEMKNLLLGPKLIIWIQSIRFLTDFIQGDVYYKTEYEEHNLVRTRNQLSLLKQIEKNEDELEAIITRQLANHLNP